MIQKSRYRHASLVIAAFGIAVLCVVNSTRGESWGTLSGRFVYDGTAPKPIQCNVTKDVAVCTKHHPVEEDLVVGEQNGIANVLVWIRTEGVAVHPDYEKTAKAVLVSDNLNCRFAPHVAAVRTGQTLRLTNSDTVSHNSLGLCRANPQFNENLPAGGQKDVVFTATERLPFTVSCAIHPWMKSYVLVKDHPYMSVSSNDGSFELSNLPAGVPLEIQVWHEKAGYVSEVSRDGQAADWARGRFTVTLTEGENALGDLVVSPKAFE